MRDYQQEFLDFAIATGALRFGEFTLKSGRLSPYFFNTGLFNSGRTIAQLGQYYASAIMHSGIGFDMMFGPAYKGVPLVVATVIALHERHQRDVPYAFNRKEAKKHAEGGTTVGAPISGRVLIIDDVISAGTSVRESVTIIRAAGAQPAGVIISLDRQERGTGTLSAVQEVQEEHHMPVTSIVTLRDLIEYLRLQPGKTEIIQRMQAYQAQYAPQPAA